MAENPEPLQLVYYNRHLIEAARPVTLFRVTLRSK